MVTVKPEPTSTAPSDGPEPADVWPLVRELRLNLSALGVDHLAPDFGERLCEFATDNPPWQFEYSAQGELAIVPPPGSDSSREEAVVSGELYVWQRTNGGMSYGPTVGFRLPSGAQRIPDAAWIAQERHDNLTPAEHWGTINGAPDFVIEVRSRSDRLPPFLAKMQEWIDGGATLGWGIDSRQRRAYVYRAGVAGPEILENPETLSGEELLPGFVFEVRRLIFDRISQEEPR